MIYAPGLTSHCLVWGLSSRIIKHDFALGKLKLKFTSSARVQLMVVLATSTLWLHLAQLFN